MILTTILILSTSAVFAEDVSYENNVYVDANAADGGVGTLENPYKDLKTAIANSGENTNIILREGVYTGFNNFNLTLTTDNIKITNYEDEEVIITTTNTHPPTRFINITANNVILDGLKFQNVSNMISPGQGGAIYWDGSNAIVDNCLFENVKTGNINGVAIFFEQGNALVKNSIFLNNSIMNSGTPIGGILTFNGTNNRVINSRFDSNIGGRGAINSQKGGLTVEDCNFTNEKRYYTYAAGAISAVGDDNNIKSSKFIGLNAGTNAGAIMGVNGTFIIDDCEFTNSTVGMGRGGAVYLENSTFEITNSNFIGGASSYGGGICAMYSNGTIDGCTFDKNVGHNFGGSIYLLSGNYTVSNSNFTNSRSMNSGGFIYSDSNNTVITGCNFENARTNGGGAIYTRGVNATIENVNIKNCTSSGSGGAIYCDSNNTVIRNFNITDSGNLYYVNNYGVVTIRGNNTVVENGLFKNIYSTNYGGSIGWYGNNGTLRDVTFENSHIQTSDAGAVYWVGNGSTIDNCKFLNCSANANAGTLTWITSDGTISNCVFVNSSCGNTGFVLARGNNNSIVNSSFDNSKSMNYGGIFISGNNTVIDNCNFTNINNTLSGAGGITMTGSSATISNCNFENISGTTGGSIYLTGSANIENNTFQNVQALYTGGTIEFRGNGNITGNNITNSHTQYFGGGINFNGNGTISNNSFVNCSVDGRGGAVYNNVGSSLTISNNEMVNCTAGIYGHDVFNSGTIGKLSLIVNRSVVYTVVNRTSFVLVKLTDDNGDDVTVSELNCRVSDNVTNFTKDFVFINNEYNATGFNITFNETGTYVLYPVDTDSHIIFDELNNLTIIVDDYMPVKIAVHNLTAHVEDTQDIIIHVLDYNDEKVYNGTISAVINGLNYTANVSDGQVVFSDIYLGDDAGYYPITVNYTSLHDYYFDAEGGGYIRLGLYHSSVSGEDVKGIVGENKTTNVYARGEHGELLDGTIRMSFPDGSTRTVESGSTVSITLPEESGSYNVTLRYSGDDEHYSSSGVLHLSVGLDETNISSVSVDSYPGDIVNVTFSVVDEFNQTVKNGSVEFILDNVTYTGKVVNGTVSFEVTLPNNEGFYQVNVTYDGNGHYDYSYTTLTLNLTKLETEITTQNITAYEGETQTIQIELTDSNGNPINDNVTITLPTGESIKVPTNTDINIYCPKAGTYTLPIVYSGSNQYKASNTTYIVIIKEKINVNIITPNNITLNKSGSVNITITITDGDKPVNNGTATLVVENNNYTSNVTNGSATFVDVILPNRTGKYTFIIYYNGTGIYNDAISYLTVIIVGDKKYNPSKNSQSNHIVDSNSLSNIPTGNPILLLLFALACIILPIKKR